MPFFQLLWKYFEKKNQKWFTIIPLYLIHGLFIGSSLLIFIFFLIFITYPLIFFLLLFFFIYLYISLSQSFFFKEA